MHWRSVIGLQRMTSFGGVVFAYAIDVGSRLCVCAHPSEACCATPGMAETRTCVACGSFEIALRTLAFRIERRAFGLMLVRGMGLLCSCPKPTCVLRPRTGSEFDQFGGSVEMYEKTWSRCWSWGSLVDRDDEADLEASVASPTSRVEVATPAVDK